MARYLNYISEGEIRDEWYAIIVNKLNQMGINNVTIPELKVGNNGRADLVTYICRNGYCHSLFLFEFKNQPGATSRKSTATSNEICTSY